MSELPIPAHFDPVRVGDVWQVSYQQRAAQAEQWARRHGIAPASEDVFRICLVVVDVQNTFCLPGFELFVGGRSGTGAVDDNVRLCEFLYRNLGAITQVVPTLDTHQAMQIFHAIWLVDGDGRHPAPYTLVSAEDVERGSWRVNPAVCRSLVPRPGNRVMILASEKQALQGRRECQYAGILARPRTRQGAALQPPRAHRIPRTRH